MRPLFTIVLAALVVTGCGTDTATPPRGETTTATATVTTTTTATPSTAAADVGLAARLAALACQSYVFAGTLDAASGSDSYDEAASTGTSAAVVDPVWTDLAGALAFMAALPLTDNTAADVDRAVTETALIRSRCQDAGVAVD